LSNVSVFPPFLGLPLTANAYTLPPVPLQEVLDFAPALESYSGSVPWLTADPTKLLEMQMQLQADAILLCGNLGDVVQHHVEPGLGAFVVGEGSYLEKTGEIGNDRRPPLMASSSHEQFG
jgi:hypothetical protein